MITINSGLSGKYFSATIPDISFGINGHHASVRMQIDGQDIFFEDLYPASGVINLRDIPALITPYARKSLAVHLDISISEKFNDDTPTNNASLAADVVYCEADIDTPAADFINTHFLSLMIGTRTTAIGRMEYLHYIGTDQAQVQAHYDDHSKKTFTLEPIAGNEKYTTIDVSPAQFTKEGHLLTYYIVTAGKRSQEYDIDFAAPDCAPILLFDNSFGVEELLYCTGTATMAPSFKRNVANIEGKQRNYSIEETRTMKADTGVMNYDTAAWTQELFRSKFVRVITFVKGQANIGKEILITDSKTEYTNKDDELPRFTFSYQYAQHNQNVLSLLRAGRIFDNTFDNTFN